MHFKKIEIQNFGTIGNVTLDLENRGLILISGRNMDTTKADSNGAGKSLLLEAFCWCVWGRTIRDEKDDAVVNRQVGKNCVVRVYFEEKDKQFIIARYRKHEEAKKPNDLELYLNGTDLSGASMRATQDVVEGLVGLSFETFCALMPGASKNAAQMTDANIKELLENMLQITALARARQEADKRLKEVRTKISVLDQAIQSLGSQVSVEQKRLAGYLKDQETHEAIVAEKRSKLNKRLEEIAPNLAALWSWEKEGTKSELALVDVTEQRAECYKKLEEIQKEYKKQKATYAHLVQELEQARSRVFGERKVYETNVQRIDQLGATCDVCSQEVSDALKSEISAKCYQTYEALGKDYMDLTSNITHVELKRAAMISEYSNKEAQQQSSLQALDVKIKDLRGMVQQGKIASVQIPGLLSEEKSLNQQITALEEPTPYETWIQQSKDQIATLEQEIKDKTEERGTFSTQEQQLVFWKDAFSTSGIRSFILDNVTPVLNERVKHYCDVLTSGEMGVEFSTKTKLKNGEVIEKFSINITQEHGGEGYTSNSSGERQRANLVVAFALSDLAEMHSNKRIDFRFLDEPFEGIDEAGVDAVVALLREQQTKYPTVFVVTHQSHFKDVFQAGLTMVKQHGISHLEE